MLLFLFTTTKFDVVVFYDNNVIHKGENMATSKKLDEITELAMLLQNSWQGLTIDEMMVKLERSNRRAIERLMEVIKEKFGNRLELVPHKTDRKNHWRLKKGSMNFLVTFSDLELSRLQKLSNSIKNEGERKCVLDIIEKIKALNPANNYQTDIDILLETQGLAVKQYQKENISSDIMDKIAYALQSEQKMKILYLDSELIVEPYGIKIGDNHYLIGKENNKIKTFKISRIQKAEVLEGEYFDKAEDFDIQEYCNRSFGVFTGKIEEVVLKFSPQSAADASNYHFHPTQRGEFNDDGSYTLIFNASGNYEIITELLKWRETVNIIKPLSLKKEYKETVRLMYENIMKG